MTRIDDTFARLSAAGQKAFVSFVMAGDPDYDRSLSIVRGLPEAGVDIIELGMPFTDPMADGPSVQLAGQRALEAGMTLEKTLQFVRDFRTGGKRKKRDSGGDYLCFVRSKCTAGQEPPEL